MLINSMVNCGFAQIFAERVCRDIQRDIQEEIFGRDIRKGRDIREGYSGKGIFGGDVQGGDIWGEIFGTPTR